MSVQACSQEFASGLAPSFRDPGQSTLGDSPEEDDCWPMMVLLLVSEAALPMLERGARYRDLRQNL